MISLASLVTRPVQDGALGTAPAVDRDALFAVEWPELALSETEEADGLPGHTVLRAEAREGVLAEVLTATQEWLADEANAGARLVVLTSGAVSVAGEAPDPVVAPVWGAAALRAVRAPGADRHGGR
ncbi:hypothetical protein GCM10020229_79460 [Kitasatospora albolonga]